MSGCLDLKCIVDGLFSVYSLVFMSVYSETNVESNVKFNPSGLEQILIYKTVDSIPPGKKVTNGEEASFIRMQKQTKPPRYFLTYIHISIDLSY